MPIMDPKPRLDELPESIRAAFADRTLLSLPEVARLLEMYPQTLREMADQGKISWRTKGTGRVAPRRYFGIDDVARLWHTMRRAPVVGALTGAHHGEESRSPLRHKRPAQAR
jgi:hypothetical protein